MLPTPYGTKMQTNCLKIVGGGGALGRALFGDSNGSWFAFKLHRRTITSIMFKFTATLWGSAHKVCNQYKSAHLHRLPVVQFLGMDRQQERKRSYKLSCLGPHRTDFCSLFSLKMRADVG